MMVRTSGGSFVRDGFEEGMSIKIAGTEDNDGVYEISSIEDESISINGSFVDEETDGGTTIFSELTDYGIYDGDPDSIEIEIEKTRGSIFSKTFIGGDEFRQRNSFPVSPGRRFSSIEVFSKSGETSLDFVAMISPYGELQIPGGTTNSEATISDTFTYEYEIDSDIEFVDGEGISTEPFDFVIESENRIEGGKIKVNPQDDWNGFLPEFAIIGDCVCELESKNTYSIISGEEIENEIKPFFTEVDWSEENRFLSPTEIPTNDLFLRGARFKDFNFSDRLSELLGVKTGEDTRDYLNFLRGVLHILRSGSNRQSIRRAVSMILGVPYAKKRGFIREIEKDYIRINDRTFDIEPWWSTQINKGIGDYVEYMEPLVDVVSVDDYMTNIDVIKDRVEPFKVWSTFVVIVSSDIGASGENVNDIIEAINKGKDKRLEYIIEFYTEFLSDQTRLPNFGITSSHGHVSISEDLVFQDGRGVQNNEENYQSQDDYLFSFGENNFLNHGKALGGLLVKFVPKYETIAGKLKENLRNTVHLKRELGEDESDFSNEFMRMGNAGENSTTGICRILDESGELYEYESPQLNLVGTLP